MKAKMPGRRLAEAGEYFCNQCETRFYTSGGRLVCPVCGNTNQSDLVAVDIKDDPLEEEMYTPVDWHGG